MLFLVILVAVALGIKFSDEISAAAGGILGLCLIAAGFALAVIIFLVKTGLFMIPTWFLAAEFGDSHTKWVILAGIVNFLVAMQFMGIDLDEDENETDLSEYPLLGDKKKEKEGDK